jgi:hypothetical protein
MREIPVEAFANPDIADGKELRTLSMKFDGDREIEITYKFVNWEGDEFDKDMYANVISKKIMEIWNATPEGSDA